MALAPVPLTGLVPLMPLSLSTPLSAQPNAFWPFLGLQVTPLTAVQDLFTQAAE